MVPAVADQLEVLKLVTARLDSAGLAYMITGSIAAGLYGQPRMTRDIDIVAALHPPHAPRLADLLGAEFLCDADVIRDAIARRRIFSVLHREALQKVDFIVRDEREYEVEKFERRRRVEVDGQPMWMIAPEDLVLSKLVWAKDSRSELQFRDVRSIITLQPDLDWAYMTGWAIRLTVAKLLAELRT
jgi:hypothetical protein